MVVNFILDVDIPNDTSIQLILDCKELMRKSQGTQLHHEGRTKNELAYLLARDARKLMKPNPLKQPHNPGLYSSVS